MKRTKFLLTVLFTLLFSSTYAGGLNGTYTIDPGKSASSTNYTSITSAVNSLMASGASGNVIFKIADGTYNERIKMDSFNFIDSYSTYHLNGLIYANTRFGVYHNFNTVTFTSASGDSSKVKLKYPKSLTIDITACY